MRDEVDSLEQYGRRELMRFSGIVENRMENTTTIVTDIVKSIDKYYQNGDVIRSHRVSNPNRSDRNGDKLGPRQIIVRVKDPLIKRRILKCTKLLRESEYTHVRVNEDLTKRRNAIAYKARQLKKASFVANTWTMDGKIFIKKQSRSYFNYKYRTRSPDLRASELPNSHALGLSRLYIRKIICGSCSCHTCYQWLIKGCRMNYLAYNTISLLN